MSFPTTCSLKMFLLSYLVFLGLTTRTTKANPSFLIQSEGPTPSVRYINGRRPKHGGPDRRYLCPMSFKKIPDLGGGCIHLQIQGRIQQFSIEEVGGIVVKRLPAILY